MVSSAGNLLTNSHVVRECASVDVLLPSGETVSARVVARDTRNDLALVSVSHPFLSVASFRRNPIRSGEDIIALGYPYRGLLASDVNVSVGIVSAMAGLLNDTSQLQISAPVQPGNSGGPLLDQTGAIAGVVVAKLDALAVAKVVGDIPQNVNFAIKSEVAQSFLRSNGIEPLVAPSAAKRAPVADLVQTARGYTLLIECDTGKAAREAQEKLAAETADQERLAKQRRDAEASAEAEKQTLARQKAEADRAEIDAKLQFDLPVK